MPADQELIHGRTVVTQEVVLMSPQHMRASGMTTRDALSMGWYVIDPDRVANPPCDIIGCTFVHPDVRVLAESPTGATYRVSTSRGLFRKRKSYFSCPDHLDTVKAALVFGHSGDPA
ncbi:hypothetical protein ACFVV7_00160 [Streptomyces globisporus]|uniref:hypothetical protein n=1 Tax=Streptomyces TaxID=1883 RepID=UPI003665C45B